MVILQSDKRRRPRFRRAETSPLFRLTEGDIEIVRLIATHRFLQSTHIAALTGRSLDRVNDRLLRLFHAGYVDRPRAQLDYYPSRGSAPMVYALAGLGARLLDDGIGTGHSAWDRKNRSAGRPFIEHQLGIVDFGVSLELGVRRHPTIRFIRPAELVAMFPCEPPDRQNPFALRVRLGDGKDTRVIPDFVFGLGYPDLSRRCFMVEIDRGTMPIHRSDPEQSSFERKLRAYAAVQSGNVALSLFGWKSFRVLVVAPDKSRTDALIEACRKLEMGSRLFLFATPDALRQSGGPTAHSWKTASGVDAQLV